MLELQPYDRQPDETESAWVSFCCYRDLGEGRTIEAANKAYRASKGIKGHQRGVSRHSIKWRKQHDWDSRCAAFDRDRAAKIQDALLEEDKIKYIDSVESFRKNLENIGKTALANVNISMALTTNTMNILMKRKAKDAELDRADLQTILVIGKRDRDSMAIAESANKLLTNAYGLVPIVERLNAIETED